MHFVGIDLAWGERAPSGLAVLDAHGRLVHVSAATTDDTVTEALEPWTGGDCLVAVDAPLIVVNDTGNRPCEAELNRDFRAYEAGAHPANRGKREFRDTPRGARLAARLGLDIDPVSASRRRAIEVYPHPATVALFDLPRTLKYKAKPGRTLETMRAELLRLVELLEGLADAPTPLLLRHSDAWRTLRGAVAGAGTKAALRRSEDQVDAVVCAYVALFTSRRPRETTIYGDGATGYIVTPTLPSLLPPSVAADRARAAAPGSGAPAPLPEPVARAVRRYAALQPTLVEPTQRWTEAVRTLLDDAGINYLSVTGRTKSVASFAAKAVREVDGRPAYDDPLTGITDQIGVRVITYVHSDVAAVAQLFSDQLVVLDDRDLGEQTASEGRFGYASRHLLVHAARHDPGLGDHAASVQVRTVLQHAWAEFEHDIRYKGTIPDEHVSDLDRRFTLAAGLLELADREFSAIRERLRTTGPADPADPADPVDPRVSGQELAAFLSGQYADAGWSRSDHYTWIAGLLLELGVTGLDELAALLASVDSGALIARMGYRYPAGAVRRLDDALLAIFGERYVALHGNAHRTELLRTRLERLADDAGPDPAGTDGPRAGTGDPGGDTDGDTDGEPDAEPGDRLTP